MGEAAFDSRQQGHGRKRMDCAASAAVPGAKPPQVCSSFGLAFPKTGLEQAKNLLFRNIVVAGNWRTDCWLLKRRVPGVFLFATLLVFYPLIYYITFPTARYRHAIDPELAILAVFSLSSMQCPVVNMMARIVKFPA